MKRSMKLLSLVVILALVMPVITNAQAGKANFAGTWVYNATKSPQPAGGPGGGAPGGGAPGGGGQGGPGGGMMRMGGGDRVVTQEANLLTSSTTRQGQDGTPVTTALKYTLDGKETINANPRGDSKSVATWSADGKTLTIKTSRTMDMNGQSMTMNTEEAWTLTDPKTLTIVSTRNGMDGTPTKTTAIFDKK
jgi:hypothetical protein